MAIKRAPQQPSNGDADAGDYVVRTQTLNVAGDTVVDPSAATLSGALPAGTNNIGDVDVASIAAGNNNIGDVDVASIAAGTNGIGNVGVIPRTTGGLTIYRNIDLDETGISVKGSAGQVFGWYLYNNAVATRYVKFYNKATAATVGTDVPVLTIPVPPGAAANSFTETGIAFATGISVGAVTAVADNSTGAPAANDVVVNVFYA